MHRMHGGNAVKRPWIGDVVTIPTTETVFVDGYDPHALSHVLRAQVMQQVLTTHCIATANTYELADGPPTCLVCLAVWLKG